MATGTIPAVYGGGAIDTDLVATLVEKLKPMSAELDLLYRLTRDHEHQSPRWHDIVEAIAFAGDQLDEALRVAERTARMAA